MTIVEGQMHPVTSLSTFRVRKAIEDFIASEGGQFFQVLHDDEEDVSAGGLIEIRAHVDLLIDGLNGDKHIMESGDAIRFRPRLDIPLMMQLQYHVSREKQLVAR